MSDRAQDWLWARFDVCTEVNRKVNAARAGDTAAAIATAKVHELQAAGVPGSALQLAELSNDEGGTFAPVVLVEDRIARWVLRHSSDQLDHIHRKSDVIRPLGG